MKPTTKYLLWGGLIGGVMLGFPFLFCGFDNLKIGLAKIVWGITIGVMLTPEFERKAFKKAGMLQTICGIIGGFLIAVILKSNFVGFFGCMFAGAIIGSSAHLWYKVLSHFEK